MRDLHTRTHSEVLQTPRINNDLVLKESKTKKECEKEDKKKDRKQK